MGNSFQKQNLPLRVVLNRVGEASLTQYGVSRAAIDTPEAIYSFWRDVIADDPTFEPDKEHLVAILLNTKLRPIGYHIVSVGSLNEAVAHPREVFRAAIISAAYGFVLAHNHPSGDPTPSQADCRLTRQIADGAALLQITLLDHVVIGSTEKGQQAFHSFREAGLL